MIAEKIIQLRKERGWSQEQLAEQLGISRQSVSKWESDMAVPDLDRIIKMSDLFGVSVDYLVKDEKMSQANYGAGSVSEGQAPERNQIYTEQNDALGNQTSYNNELFGASANGMSYGAESIGAVGSENSYFYGSDAAAAGGRVVSAQEAESYMNLVEQTSKKIAMGVTLCIISPVLLIFLSGLAGNSLWGVTEGAAAGVGVTVLLCIVTAAVSLFIMNGLKLEKYEYLEKEKIVIDKSTRAAVENRKAGYESKFQRGIAAGVIICIVSVIPVVASACMLPSEDTYTENGADNLLVICCIALLLIMVSVGVNIIVRVSSVWGSYQKLLQEGDYTETIKADNSKIEAFAGIYWCVVTAIYLGLNFSGLSEWGRSWIIWPVAGVIFGAICGIIRIVSAGKK